MTKITIRHMISDKEIENRLNASVFAPLVFTAKSLYYYFLANSETEIFDNDKAFLSDPEKKFRFFNAICHLMHNDLIQLTLNDNGCITDIIVNPEIIPDPYDIIPKIKQLLGISSLTVKNMAALKKWKYEYGCSDEIIMTSCEYVSVSRARNFSHLNACMNLWHKKGYTSVDKVKDYFREKEKREKASTQP